VRRRRSGPFSLVPVPGTASYDPVVDRTHSHDPGRGTVGRDLADLDTLVAQRLRAKELRYTRSRRQVVAVLASADRPLTIPDILERDATLSQSSTYRNLTELIAAGAAHRITSGDEYSHFELAEDLTEHHHHLVCVRCGRVEDFVASDELEDRLHAAVDDAVGDTGFSIQHHRLDLIGTCGACTAT